MVKKCEAPGCTRMSNEGKFRRGYCSLHYQRLMKYGDPLAGDAKYLDPRDALRERTVKRDGCTIWTGSKNQKGYGRIRVNDRLESAHRIAYELATGEAIPSDMEVDHICLNRDCVEPSHLRLSDRSRNTQHRRGAQPNSKSGIRNVHFMNGAWYVRLKIKQKNRRWGPFESVEGAMAEAARLRREHFPGSLR